MWSQIYIHVPDLIIKYNKNFGGVGLSSALVAFYSLKYKTTKCYNTLYFNDVASSSQQLPSSHNMRQEPNQTHKDFME